MTCLNSAVLILHLFCTISCASATIVTTSSNLTSRWTSGFDTFYDDYWNADYCSSHDIAEAYNYRQQQCGNFRNCTVGEWGIYEQNRPTMIPHTSYLYGESGEMTMRLEACVFADGSVVPNPTMNPDGTCVILIYQQNDAITTSWYFHWPCEIGAVQIVIGSKIHQIVLSNLTHDVTGQASDILPVGTAGPWPGFKPFCEDELLRYRFFMYNNVNMFGGQNALSDYAYAVNVPAPITILLDDATDNQIKITWPSLPNGIGCNESLQLPNYFVISYLIQIDTSTEFATPISIVCKRGENSESCHFDSRIVTLNVDEGQNYHVRIAAENLVGASDWSNVYSYINKITTTTPEPTTTTTPVPNTTTSSSLSKTTTTTTPVPNTTASSSLSKTTTTTTPEPTTTTTPEPSPELEFFSHGNLDDANSCEMRCPIGFYQLGGLSNEVCKRHSELTCNAGQYFKTGTHLFDAKCVTCSGCEAKRLISKCFNVSDDICEDCAEQYDPHGIFVGENCQVRCDENYVLNTVSNLCEFCASFKCPPGFRTAYNRHNCTHCQKCDNKLSHSHWMLEENREDCSWACDVNYALNIDEHNIECVPQRLSYDKQLAHEALNLKCIPGETLYNFKCTSCWEAPHIPQTSLPVKDTHNVKWDWVYECHWACFRPQGYQKFQSLTHWDCILSTRRAHLVMGDNLKIDWADIKESTNTEEEAIEKSSTRKTKQSLFWVFISLISIPVVFLMLNVILALIRNKQTQTNQTTS